jgi:hypothetical protein
VNRKALQLALREMQAATVSRYSRIGMILAIVLLAVSGPFGTFQSFNIGQRVGYWAVMVVGSYLVGQAAATFFLELLREQIDRKWPRVLLAGLLASLPVTMGVLLVNGVAYQHVGVADSLSIWMYTTLVTLAVVVVFVSFGELMGGAQANQTEGVAPAAAETPPPMQAAATPPVLERVPLPQRGRLLALTVEDHYVDIVTDRGKTLVLMRLADAIREAAPVPGLQIHRSHWVALDAVRRTERSDGKTTVELSNGLRLPISRGYMAMARDAGLVG